MKSFIPSGPGTGILFFSMWLFLFSDEQTVCPIKAFLIGDHAGRVPWCKGSMFFC